VIASLWFQRPGRPSPSSFPMESAVPAVSLDLPELLGNYAKVAGSTHICVLEAVAALRSLFRFLAVRFSPYRRRHKGGALTVLAFVAGLEDFGIGWAGKFSDQGRNSSPMAL